MRGQHAPIAVETFIDAGPSRLFVREVGEGMPIVVVHGGPEFDHTYLLPDLDRLSDGYRLIYYDQRGRGRSFRGEGPNDVTLEGEIDDLDRVREWSGAGRVAVLGHSWGGVLAMEYAIRRPDRESHLILMDTAPASHAGNRVFRDMLVSQRTPEESARVRELLADPDHQAGDVALDEALFRIHFRPALARPEHVEVVVGRLRTWFSREGIVAARAIEDHLYEQTWDRPDYDLIPALRGLRVPTLLLHGEFDFVPLEAARLVADAIPGARLEVIPEAGHFPFLEQPDRVRSSIDAFLKP